MADPPAPRAPIPEGFGALYVTFGTQYARDPHPAGPWVHPDGYLTVLYRLTEPHMAFGEEGVRTTRERARWTMWNWLGGHYAFDSDEVPEERWCPRGEVARMVLP